MEELKIIQLSEIQKNPYQPRKDFSEEKIQELQEQKKHLENLGFVVGGEIIVVNESAGNLIVNVKESRVGVSLELAKKIMI